jgi:hypothetical protein
LVLSSSFKSYETTVTLLQLQPSLLRTLCGRPYGSDAGVPSLCAVSERKVAHMISF